MDYEQKYKEALNWMRSIYTTMQGADREDAEHHFPELKELEDEMIRKDIVEYLKSQGASKRWDFNTWIAWLEKQGEKNPKHFELKAGHWYICHRAFCCRADHLTVKEGERFMCEKDGVVKGFVIKDPENYFKEVCAPAPIEIEKKPSWSKEDERMLSFIDAILEYAYNNNSRGFGISCID